MALQAYIDESGNGQPPALVIGGFIGSSEKWAAFSDEWRVYLDMKPSLEYFKASEATSLSGQFLDWSPQRRDERVALLNQVVLNHAMLATSMLVQQKQYHN
jgi:hypothetical protein